MPRDDWFRHETWNSSIEAAFFAKLDRVRRKAQYLRIQAFYLVNSHPQAALALLDRYFEQQDDFDHALAHLQRARACLALGDESRAISAYQSAVKREAEFPNVKTEAWLEYAVFVALEQKDSLYKSTLALLAERQSDAKFPVDLFRWHAAYALIYAATGHHNLGSEHACQALSFSRVQHAGLRYHPDVGLVTDSLASVVSRLYPLCE